MAEDRSLPIKFSIWHTFKHHIPRFLLTILLDVLLPLAIYIKLQQVVRPVYALLAASSPPLCMILIKAIWFRTFDALGFLVFFSFIVTALIAVISRNPLIILLEKSLITGILSIMFGVTLIPIEICQKRFRWRPLAFYFYQDLVPTRRKDLGLSDEIQQVQVQFHYNQLSLKSNNFDINKKLVKSTNGCIHIVHHFVIHVTQSQVFGQLDIFLNFLHE